jgi:hypothetical protein
MAAATQLPSVAHAAQAELLAELARIMELHAQRVRDPARSAALERLADWQARRLRSTYDDLARQPRYAAAITFFQTDLYGGADFARRDADLARVVPVMVRMLPERVIGTIAHAMSLNVLSHELDRALLERLPRASGQFSVAEYCRAFRAMGDRPGRERQIALIGEIGAAIDGYVRKPLIHAAMVMMRGPARLAGVSVLHDFLERGFDAFRGMGGAREFLATVAARETALLDRIYGGEDAPFPEPPPAAA